MRLSKASAYAVFAAVHIARHEGDGPVQGRTIAQAYDLPVEYLLKILQQLVRSGVLTSAPGRRGGFALHHPADETTLLHIVEAVDGPLNGHLAVSGSIVGADALMRNIEGLCNDIAASTRMILQQTTLQQLMAKTACEPKA